jgi:RNA 3'-terminal phosphate cyclase (ATP)
VGALAARALREELERNVTADLHLSDQLLIYLAEYGGKFTARDLSSHAATHIRLLEQFGMRVNVHRGAVVEVFA